ncbi:hypothetical protein CWR48_12600 [Oceanobacillus arenosus]|uniref:Uncharacterized protein n=1 Tax=Oceanobacillus arenosus TaxID=1229153 RepID=A0A3D8PS70_9BACI|nr:hypothetical protein [Oceanobacillus arenosus]RDW18407.1 hypothetical protein CWR48_12600 [Oceanobacillus arenosus]
MLAISNWINGFLEIFEIKTSHFYFILVLIAILTSYMIMKPVITWIVSFKSTKLLTYLMSSLVVMLSIFIMSLFVEQPFDIIMFKTLLQAISTFGIVLALFYTIVTVIKKA